jgi:AraC family transcriptional regulator of adaptative response/methylated-DNA-[protein]-cysteine methyltransferase
MNSAALWRIRWAWKLAPQNVLLKGTPFQLSIWKALIDSPSLTHYSSLAEQAGCPKSYRAAANALGENPVPLLIPCHHVLRRHGALGGFRYGVVRKHAMLAWEIARAGAKTTDSHPHR